MMERGWVWGLRRNVRRPGRDALGLCSGLSHVSNLKLVAEMEDGIYPAPWWVVIVFAGFKVN